MRPKSASMADPRQIERRRLLAAYSRTPMGYNFAAFSQEMDGSVDFSTIRSQIRAGGK